MKMTDAERAARKSAQLARVAAKGSPDYPELYAKQPEQQRLREQQQTERRLERQKAEAEAAQRSNDAQMAAGLFGNLETR